MIFGSMANKDFEKSLTHKQSSENFSMTYSVAEAESDKYKD